MAALFVMATAFSTLALGEHYLVDLIVAIPFTLIFQAGCTASIGVFARSRLLPFLAGTGLTILWLILLRYGIGLFSPAFSWGLILATMGLCFVLEKNLADAAQTSRLEA